MNKVLEAVYRLQVALKEEGDELKSLGVSRRFYYYLVAQFQEKAIWDLEVRNMDEGRDIFFRGIKIVREDNEK
jgi:hypothetical protein